ncbi:unnamed protein product, partial [Schistosoma turkestanicum]
MQSIQSVVVMTLVHVAVIDYIHTLLAVDYGDVIYSNIMLQTVGTSIQKTEFFHETQPHLDYHLPMNHQSDYHHYDYNAKKRDTIISNGSSILEQNKIRPIKNCLLPSQTNTATNKSRLNVYNSPKH